MGWFSRAFYRLDRSLFGDMPPAVVPAQMGAVSRYTLSDYLKQLMQFGGLDDPIGYRTSYGNLPAEPIGGSYQDYVQNAYKSCGPVFACQSVRLKVFSEARFQFQRMRNGRPGELFGTADLGILERPWPGGTTGDLLARMILTADIAGNWFGTIIDDEVVSLRPDWTDIILAPRFGPNGGMVGHRKVGYVYYEGGKDNSATGLTTLSGEQPEVFPVNTVAHFAPSPDPAASYRGMSWFTPVLREIQSDMLATRHKIKFWENAATPNLAISMAKEVTPDQFERYMAVVDERSAGLENAYKTLWTAGGADVTVVGANMQQMDFKATQGYGETRIANAAGIHPAVAALAEGMQGASLNAGNFQAAKRQTAQTTFRPLWRNAAGSLEMLVPPPAGAPSRLWYDPRDIEFLNEDEKDAAEIRSMNAAALRQLADAGCDWDSAVAYMASNEVTDLRGAHSGLFSVQLQPPGSRQPTSGQNGTQNGQQAMPAGGNQKGAAA